MRNEESIYGFSGFVIDDEAVFRYQLRYTTSREIQGAQYVLLELTEKWGKELSEH